MAEEWGGVKMAFMLVVFTVVLVAILYFACSRRRSASKMEPWQRSGWLKGEGIPAPSGRLDVGCVDLMLPEGDSDAGLLVRLFYPTDPGLAGQYPYAKTAPHPRYIKASLDFLQLKWSGLISAIITPFSDTRCPALYGAPLAKDQKTDSRHPVLVFSHGVGGMRTHYTALCCELASHGYVLACVEHSDRSACITMRKIPKPGAPGEYKDEWLPMTYPGGRLSVKSRRQLPERRQQLLLRVDEVGKALDLLQLLNEGGEVINMMGERFDWGQFRGRLQLDTAAVMGHSFGGTTTLQTLYTDKRFKCGIGLDAWMLPILDEQLDQQLEQPLLLINCGFGFQWPEAIKKMMKIVKPPNDQGLMSSQIMTIKGSDHILSSDGHFIADLSLIPGSTWRPTIKPLTAHRVLSDVCSSFLSRFLLKDPAYQQRVPSLDGGEGSSEHILFGTNVDWKEERHRESDDNSVPRSKI